MRQVEEVETRDICIRPRVRIYRFGKTTEGVNIPMLPFQSSGLGTNAGLIQYVHGTLRRSTYPGPERMLSPDSPSLSVRKVLMMSPTLDLGQQVQHPEGELLESDGKLSAYPCHVSRSAAA